MAAESNVAALHAAGAHWNAGNLEAYLGLYDPDAVLHGYAGIQPSLTGIRSFYQALWAAFPGSRLVFEDVFASGDKVACRFLLQGEHRGAYQGIAATSAQISVPGITILEFRDARCIRRWSYTDAIGLLQQLGAFPSR